MARRQLLLQLCAALVAFCGIRGGLLSDRRSDEAKHGLDVGVGEADVVEQRGDLLLDHIGAVGQAAGASRPRDMTESAGAVAGIAAVVGAAPGAVEQPDQRVGPAREAAAAGGVPGAALGAQALDAVE